MGGLAATAQTTGAVTYGVASWLFVRLLGIIYLVAFVSLATQIRGLLGSGGILPARELLAARRHWGVARFWRVPTVFWINCSDRALIGITWAGAGLALCLILGVAPLPVELLLWALYLSIFTVGRIFLCYQWDILLLEAGFWAMFIATPDLLTGLTARFLPPLFGIWVLWWLLFRLMFWSGAVKLRSGDSAWRGLTALKHHYETQPLPTRLAWHAFQLPRPAHMFSTAVVLLIELVVPFLILVPGPCRYVASGAFLFLMLCIELTGNYAFFNLLGAALAVLLLDDGFWQALFASWRPASTAVLAAPSPLSTFVLIVGCVLIVLLSLEQIFQLLRYQPKWPGPLARFLDLIEPFHLVNGYGLFAVMTTWRPELILEGSCDGNVWKAYEFKWKPGQVNRAPGFVAPHQPRLDWQMWFLALGARLSTSWFERLRERLIAGTPEVLGLFRTNPFPDGPPRYVRAVYYDYRFTTRAERKATGAWWRRERRGVFEN